MKLPEQYKNLTIEQKRIVVANLIAQYWDDWIQNLVDNISDEQVEFLFTYLFTDFRSKYGWIHECGIHRSEGQLSFEW